MTNFLWWVVRWPYWVTFNQNSDFLFPKSITPLLNTIVNLKMLKGGGTSDESVYLFTRVTIIASLKRLHHWNGFGGQNVVGAFPRAFFFFFSSLSWGGEGGVDIGGSCCHYGLHHTHTHFCGIGGMVQDPCPFTGFLPSPFPPSSIVTSIIFAHFGTEVIQIKW